MKSMQKFKAVIAKGELVKEMEVLEQPDRVSDPKPVYQRFMDSVARNIVDQHGIDLKRAEETGSNLDIVFWKEIDHNPFDEHSEKKPKKGRKPKSVSGNMGSPAPRQDSN